MKEKRDSIIELLREGVYEFTFTKINGETRVMRATLRDDLIPTDKKPKGTGKTQPNDEVVRCFDVEKNEWRSMRVDSVTGVATVGGV